MTQPMAWGLPLIEKFKTFLAGSPHGFDEAMVEGWVEQKKNLGIGLGDVAFGGCQPALQEGMIFPLNDDE